MTVQDWVKCNVALEERRNDRPNHPNPCSLCRKAVYKLNQSLFPVQEGSV